MNAHTGEMETVRKSYSYKLALRSMLVIIAGAAVSTFVIFLSLSRSPGGSYAESYAIISELRRQLLSKAVGIYLVTSLFIVVGIGIITLLYSHRVAGPLHRLGMFARVVARGDLSGKVALRKNDVIHPMADDLNNMVAGYKDTLLKLDGKVQELRENVSEAGDPSAEEERAAHITEGILEKTEEIKEMLSHIRL